MTAPVQQYDPTAVMGRRIGAAIIDMVIGIAVMVGLFVVLAESASGIPNAQRFCEDLMDLDPGTMCVAADNDVYVLEDSETLTFALGVFGYAIANLVLLQGATGASIGKHIIGLRVVKQSDGSLHGFGAAIVRWLLWIVDGIPGGFFFPLVGLITSLASKGHRRVGDMAASTLVVDKSQVGIPPIVPGLTAPVAYAQPGAAAYPPPQPTTSTAPVAPPVAAPAPPTGDTGQFPPPTGDPLGSEPPASPASEVETPSEAAPTGVDEPTWDTARDTYIQWDPKLAEWMEWDKAANVWKPISQ